MVSSRLVMLQSIDKLELPGVLFSAKSSKKAALYLHGNGDSGVFYNVELVNALGAELARHGIGFLAFNNRGARYKKKLTIADSGEPGQKDTVTMGVHYELIEDCVKDIDGAIAFLETHGFEEFYLIGFSTGANKICVYDKLTNNPKVTKYVHAGPGDDSGLYHEMLGPKKFKQALQFAKNAVANNRPTKVMPKYTGMHPFSAQSTVDMIDPDGPYNNFPYFEATTKRLGSKKLFEEYSAITKPMLVIFGENDEFAYTAGSTQKALELLRSATHKTALRTSDFQLLPATDHGFHGKEPEIATRIAEWLST